MEKNQIQENNHKAVSELFNTVVQGGYCIGCGACASLPDSSINMTLDEYGHFVATLNPAADISNYNSKVLDVCPFSDASPNEDEIAQELFGENCLNHNRIGYHLATYAGFVKEGSFRQQGSSGGMVTWLLSELFQQNLIEGVIHVQQQEPRDGDGRLFQYKISTSIEQVLVGAKSRYYPVEMSEVLNTIRETPRRYAIVGVPCFIKAVRLLAKVDPVLGERIHYCIGLVCGHLKSTQFAEMFGWQCGIQPGNLLAIDFRKKILGQDANRYGTEITGLKNNQKINLTKSNQEFYGYQWGYGFFKYKACDYCDDVVAETADVVVGDAWLPGYIKDSQGTNVVLVRDPLIKKLIEQAIASERLQLDSISADDVARSQDAGLRHRREGLAYRLYLKDKKSLWRPKKRVEAKKDHFDAKLQQIHRLRVLLAEKSHIAFLKAKQAGSFKVFKDIMEPYLKAYLVVDLPWYKRLFSSVKILVKHFRAFFEIYTSR
jgi:coenzyme F420-reducing hydrogenase beta subunit